ncbi:MAG: S9 family peptidase [Anaerolineae bacterium]|nr:S9 family peptidase [Anaerolineae bacterium]
MNTPSALSDEMKTFVSMMAKTGVCQSPSFSPDSSRLALISDLSGVPQIWTISVAGGWPQRVTSLDDPVSSVEWSPDGEWLAFGLAPGGGMNQQIYLIRPDGTGLRRLSEGGKDNNWLGEWTHDGQGITVASSRRTPEAMDAYVVDPTSGQFKLVATNPGVGSLTDVSRDGRYGVVYRVANRSDSNLYLIDLRDSRETLLTPHQGPGNFTRAKFSADGKSIYIISDHDRELTALVRLRLTEQGEIAGREMIAERADAELKTFSLSKDGQVAALVWNVAGRSEVALIDLATLHPLPSPQLPVEIVVGGVFSGDGRYLALTATGAAAPRDIWVFDRATGNLRQVTESQHAGVRLSDLIQPELVQFTAHDGLPLSGWLYRPRGITTPAPTVLSFHGGPEGQEVPYFNATYQALLAQGIAVFAPNVRGSSGFGKTFVNLDNGALRFNAVQDIKSCADQVVKMGVADPKRLGIMGGSYGGYMTMAGLTEFPDLFAAGANLFGIVNFKTFFEHTEPWMAAISKIEYGDPDSQADLLDQLSPIYKLDRVKGATIVLHGANDTNVPVVEAEQVVDSLKKLGVPVEYVLFPDEGHGFRKEPNRIQSTVSIVQWFVRYLKEQ